jgi:acyl transferase domain-containing protein
VLEYALTQLWRSWGVEPEILLGHSVGELAAACVAGVFSLEDGLRLAAARGRLMGALPQEGDGLPPGRRRSRVREAIASYTDELSIAAVNGPASVVLSGRRGRGAGGRQVSGRRGVKGQRLNVSHAFHSPLMEPMLEAFRQVAERVTYHKPGLRLVSNVTGQLAGDEIATPEYWVRHVCATVRFADGVQTLYRQGCRLLMEMGPQATLLKLAERCLGEPVELLASLNPGHSDWQQVLESAGRLYAQGIELDWQTLDRGRRGARRCAGRRIGEERSHLLLVSARSETALAAQAVRYADWLEENPAVDLADVCFGAFTSTHPLGGTAGCCGALRQRTCRCAAGVCSWRTCSPQPTGQLWGRQAQNSLPLHRAGGTVQRHGAGALRDRARFPLCPRPLRPGLPGLLRPLSGGVALSSAGHRDSLQPDR